MARHTTVYQQGIRQRRPACLYIENPRWGDRGVDRSLGAWVHGQPALAALKALKPTGPFDTTTYRLSHPRGGVMVTHTVRGEEAQKYYNARLVEDAKRKAEQKP